MKPDLKVNVAKIGVKESVKWNTFFFLNPACHVYLLLSNHSIYCVTWWLLLSLNPWPTFGKLKALKWSRCHLSQPLQVRKLFVTYGLKVPSVTSDQRIWCFLAKWWDFCSGPLFSKFIAKNSWETRREKEVRAQVCHITPTNATSSAKEGKSYRRFSLEKKNKLRIFAFLSVRPARLAHVRPSFLCFI